MKKAIFWMRRDMRFDDNHALSIATYNFDAVYPVFIFDKNILDKIKNKSDPRVSLIYDRLASLGKSHKIHIYYGDPVKLIPDIARELGAQEVFANEDYESYAKTRDSKISKEISLNLYKDTVVFRYDEILNGKNEPYKVFTAYKNKWIKDLESNLSVIYKYKIELEKLKYKKTKENIQVTSLADISFEYTSDYTHAYSLDKVIDYDKNRDFPQIEGTSRVSVSLRFGLVSVRSLIREIMPTDNNGKKVWLSELIWREFYFQILVNFPHVEKKSYRPEYEKVKWTQNNKLFKAWCEGKTGVPIVDAGMRELNTTGFMHNRVRMITASYLCKTLLLDWRLGEKYFAEKLLDFDLAANNGGWQWCASTGCDSAPYFRIFNPYTQGKRFDKDCLYIKKYVEELKEVDIKAIHNADKNPLDYASPIVDYSKQRIRALALYKKAKEEYSC